MLLNLVNSKNRSNFAIANKSYYQTMANTLIPIQKLSSKQIESKIMTIRGVQVMLDRDLAQMYNVETRVLNQAVKRNAERFPEGFMFQLNNQEFEQWRSQIVISNSDKMGLRYAPYCFTEQGVAMLSAVLKSPVAIQVSIQIMEAFVEMRHTLVANDQIIRRLETIEHHQLSLAQHQVETDSQIEEVFKRLDEGQVKPQQGIFFDGQVYDAYKFVSNLVRKAKKRIVLIDNYVDDTVLTLLDKRASGVKATIYTKFLNKQLQLDIVRHNNQYPRIEVFKFTKAHDRYLIIDNDVYHIGASIKDLGLSWCTYALMRDIAAKDLLSKIR